MNRRQFNFGLLGTAGAIAFRPVASASQPQSHVNGARLNEHLKALSEFGKNPQGGVSRVAYSEADRQGREYVLGLMRAAKLDTSIDAAGNLVGRRAGSDKRIKPNLVGATTGNRSPGGDASHVCTGNKKLATPIPAPPTP